MLVTFQTLQKETVIAALIATRANVAYDHYRLHVTIQKKKNISY